MKSKREKHLEDGLVVLSLMAEDLERELANMEQLLEALQRNINMNPRISKKQKETDCRELEATFDVAMTAMKQVWLWITGGGNDSKVKMTIEPEAEQ